MSAPTLRQSAGNAVGSGQSRTCTATFTNPTIEKNLIVCWAVVTSGSATLTGPDGFVPVRERAQGELKLAMWYREGAPATSSVSVTTSVNRSLQVRALEYSGAAQSGALDRVTVVTSGDDRPRTGDSGIIAQADEIVVAAIANQFASTIQSGFVGGLIRLIESVSPQSWGLWDSDPDERRSRLSIHHAITNSVGSFFLSALLSSMRNWIAILATFRGGSSGPARMTSRLAPTMLKVGGTGSLTVFGPLRAGHTTPEPMIAMSSAQARIGPYNYQYRLGGWDGLLIGDDTPYRVENHDGLEGWAMRTSDDDLPRGDGALRGVDLQSARQLMFELKVGGTQAEVEQAMDTLYRALVPQRDSDWELIWRHPGRPLRMLRCRPISLSRELSWRETLVNHQKFALLSSDPRHYSASQRRVTVPASPAATRPSVVSVLNEGNGYAYPTIRVTGPSSGEPVTRIELANTTHDVSFLVAAVLPKGSTLLGDMQARATGAPRSVVTIDGQSKYGAWVHPRQTFVIGPGENLLHLLTEPPGASITATLDYHDTWSG
ncbi:hypothetical protein [Pseudonocardia acaciae]|uniref:hypothetical protein n=1 Tax=Pseudonocardia acaciae TaxID=551276 RepID=UPI00048CF878|nr:hypothetical protein [Pseudonocardia acaciae]